MKRLKNFLRTWNLFSIIAFTLLINNILGSEITIVSNVQENNGSIGNPKEYCILETDKKYKGFNYRIFGKNLFLEKSIQLKANKIYLIKGKWEKDLTKQLIEIGTCDLKKVEPMQIRSDWLPEENRSEKGILSWNSGYTTWERLKEIDYFHANYIKEYTSIQCRLLKDKVVLELSLGENFQSLKMKSIAHYESYSRGKPKPKYLSKKIKFQRKNKLTFPTKLAEASGEKYNLQEISLQGTEKNLIVNVNYSVHLCKK